jgi:hypothetical protein
MKKLIDLFVIFLLGNTLLELHNNLKGTTLQPLKAVLMNMYFINYLQKSYKL